MKPESSKFRSVKRAWTKSFDSYSSGSNIKSARENTDTRSDPTYETMDEVDFSQPGPSEPKHVVKTGWLKKQAEWTRKWGRRYLVLYNDGTLNGYKIEPTHQQIIGANGPLENTFCVKNSQTLKIDEGGNQFGFKIRCKQQNQGTVIERSFRAETEADRDDWTQQLENIYDKFHIDSVVSMEVDNATEGWLDINNILPVDVQARSKAVDMDSFHTISVLGKGTFGQVFLVYKKSDPNKKRLAMKKVPKALVKAREESEHMKSERKVMSQLEHPFMIKLYHAFQTDKYLCFVMEFARGGEIYFHLSKSRHFNIRRSRLYGAEITSAFEYLHDRHIIYRDLKLENLLLDEYGHIKITDFGLCKVLRNKDNSTSTFCGTPEYLAPEILDEEVYGLEIDWWSLGVVLHEMIVGQLPFYSQRQEVLFDKICNDDLPDIPYHINDNAANILKRLLIKNRRERLGSIADAADVKAHPFFMEIDWEKLVRREIRPEFIPMLDGEDDVRFFDDQFRKGFKQGAHNPDYTFPDQPADGDRDEFPNFSYNRSLG